MSRNRGASSTKAESVLCIQWRRKKLSYLHNKKQYGSFNKFLFKYSFHMFRQQILATVNETLNQLNPGKSIRRTRGYKSWDYPNNISQSYRFLDRRDVSFSCEFPDGSFQQQTPLQ
ncbi:CLUMA_CG018339, isoform A [Clunio marinus]|uniref:CLUMA_CG018339, isoform A n=1 Tax=Clunio marinus TaxID=568069 RepID=A0A1J1IYC4_9DIPT|nr:CLUMA_CG018339, isoform A [Clunio marinus]